MADILQSSVLLRVLRAIGQFFSRQVQESRLLSVFRRGWGHSGLRRGLVALGEGEENTVRGSFVERFLRWMDHLLARLGRVKECVRSSLVGRAFRGLLTWGRESRLLGWAFCGGVTGLILTILGLYAGVDWVLRDVLPVPLLSSTWDELLLLFSVAWIFYERMGSTRLDKTRTTNLDLWAAAFVATGLLLVACVHPFPSVAVAGFRAACQYILWFFVVTRLLRDEKDLKRLYGLLLLLAFAIALHGIYQYIVGAPIPEHWTDQAEGDVRTRVYSIFGSPNIMADYMVMFAPMAAGAAYSVKDRKLKIFAWLIAFCICFACLFTMSRAGWVAMAAAIVIFTLLVDRRLFLLVLLAGVAAMFLPFVASRLGYLFTDEFAHSTANGGRVSRWALGLGHLYSSNPVLGFGLGMFGGAVAMQNQVYGHIQYFYIDNYYLKTLVEMGYLGLAMFLLMMAVLLFTGCRSLFKCRRRNDGTFPLAAGIFSGLCGVLIHCYFENIFEEPYMMATFWILAAMLVYLGFYHRKKV